MDTEIRWRVASDRFAYCLVCRECVKGVAYYVSKRTWMCPSCAEGS